jgi:hypothetical protein
MSEWPELVRAGTVRAGRAPGTVIRCGLIDTMLADLPMSVAFLYPDAPDDDTLERGLAQALDRMPAFAGRLRSTEDRLEIVCGDSGAALSSYTVSETLPEAIARLTLPGAGYADHVDAPKARLGELPLFTVRINRLSDGGMVLGCSWHHSVGDLSTFMLLMRSWSAAVEGSQPPSSVLITDPDGYLDEVLPAVDAGVPHLRLMDPVEQEEVGRAVAQAMRANRTVQVYFADAELARMRERFSAAAGSRLSINDCVCAQVASSLRELDGDTEDRWLALPVNIRPRLGLPDGVLGNLVNEIFLPCPAGTEPVELAVRIRAAVQDFVESHLVLRANRRFLAAVGRDRFAECAPVGFDPVRRTMMLTSWTNAGMYDVAFGGHRPVLASPIANLQLPWIGWLLEGFDRTGLLLTIAVPARLAVRLRSAEGGAVLHRFRQPDDALPELARTVRKLA